MEVERASENVESGVLVVKLAVVLVVEVAVSLPFDTFAGAVVPLAMVVFVSLDLFSEVIAVAVSISIEDVVLSVVLVDVVG